jgi:hypothetical protein
MCKVVTEEFRKTCIFILFTAYLRVNANDLKVLRNKWVEEKYEAIHGQGCGA